MVAYWGVGEGPMSAPFQMRWTDVGPVSAAFANEVLTVHGDPGPWVRGLMGPIGAAKTTTALRASVKRAMLQPPWNGVRYWRVGVVRDTYRNLEHNTLKSWFQMVFPREVGVFTAEQPPTHTIRMRLPDGSTLNFEIEFRAIGDHSIESITRGWELSEAYVDEADILHEDLLPALTSRVGRYPPREWGGGPWTYGVSETFNAPDIDNHTYLTFVEKIPSREEGYAFWRQPSGFSADAENLQNLPPNYYRNLAIGKEDWWVRRFIENQFGYSRSGKPVWPEFNQNIHIAPHDLVAIERLPLIIGADGGSTPALNIWQRPANGQWRGLDELVIPNNESCGPGEFGEMLARVLHDNYPDFQISGWGDPAADYEKTRGAQEDESWLEIFSNACGVRFRPAPTNSIYERLEAVRRPLTKLIDGREPGVLMSPRMRRVIRANAGDYRYRRTNIGGGRFEDKPEKNEASHPADAEQYAFIGGSEYHEIRGREKRRTEGLKPRASTDFDVMGG